MYEAQNRAQQWTLINSIVKADMTVEEENAAALAILQEQCRFDAYAVEVHRFT
jgi:hypothetical protein